MSKKILVIDDDTLNLKLIRANLERSDFDVLTAEEGKAGLELAAKENPDLIILDVEMPTMNGYTFMNEKKKDGSISSIPVIVLTAHSDMQPIFQLKGVKDYIVKPVEPDELLQKINAQLEAT